LIETSQGRQRGRCDKESMLLSVIDMEESKINAVAAKPLPAELRARIGFPLGLSAADFATAARRRSSAQSTGKLHVLPIIIYLHSWIRNFGYARAC
jgi:hypothetical protein